MKLVGGAEQGTIAFARRRLSDGASVCASLRPPLGRPQLMRRALGITFTAPMKYCHSAVLAALVTLAGCTQGTWTTFVSSSGYAVSYPGAWHRIGTSPDRLDIVSSTQHAEGVVIAPGEAEIVVLERTPAAGAAVSDVIARDVLGDSVLSRRELPHRGRPCDVLTEVVSRSQVGPDTYERDTEFYCALAGHIFTTTLRSWPDDRRQDYYRRLAEQVAASLHLLGT